jgi:hypothetical protein
MLVTLIVKEKKKGKEKKKQIICVKHKEKTNIKIKRNLFRIFNK